MPTYFKPLRRTIGVGTLVLACALMGLALRAQFASDMVKIDSGNRWHVIYTLRDRIRWHSYAIKLSPKPPPFSWHTTDPSDLVVFFAIAEPGPTTNPQTWDMPLFAVIIPLTLFSACMLLSNPNFPSTLRLANLRCQTQSKQQLL